MMNIPAGLYEMAALMSKRIDGAAGYLSRYDQFFEGRQPSSFMSPESLAAMDGRCPTLNINFVRLAILSLAERLRLVGFCLDGVTEPDADVWRTWTRCGMDYGADTAHIDAMISGRSYAIVWADEYGDPLITAESARHCSTITDPATGRVIAGLKRYWIQPDPDTPLGQGVQVVMTPERVVTMKTSDDVPISGFPPGSSWTVTESLPNPLGVAPIVPLINGYGRRIGSHIEGESEMADLTSLQDAVNKLAMDLLVTSETSARPRRWATGMELRARRDPDTGEELTDDDGEIIFEQPFDPALDRVWTSEQEATRFGQFEQADLSPYSGAIQTLTSQIGAIATLPAHYTGLLGDQPPSADSLRAAEASITSRATGKIRMFTPRWADVARLEVGLRTGRDPRTVDVEPLWANPETRTPSQDSDEAAKLGALGVPLTVLLREVLGWTPEQVNATREARLAEAIDRAATAPPQPPPGQPPANIPAKFQADPSA